MIKKFCSFYKPHWRLFTFDLICAFLLAICNLIYPQIAKNIINDFVPNRQMNFLLLSCLGLLFIYAIKALLNYSIQYWGHMVGVRIQADMRKTLFKKLERLPFSYYDENKTGTIMSRIINDLMDISELAHHGPEDIFISVVSFVGAFIMLALINIYLSLIVFAVIPLIVLFAVSRRLKQKKAFKQMRIETAEINSQVESAIAGIRVTRAYNGEEHELDKFEESNNKFQIARGAAYRQMGIFNSGMTFFTDFLYLLVLFAGGLFFFYDIIDVGEFTAYILYITMLINPIRTMVSIFEQLQSGMTGFERFLEVMDEKEEVEEKNSFTMSDIKKGVYFKDVTFHYGNTDRKDDNKDVLSHLNLEIPCGKTVALVGPSGGGKSTLCHLIPRFYKIDSGAILIDDCNINQISRSSLRKHVGIVDQDVFLFSGSIKENIAYGNLDASEEEIIEAAKRANIHDYVMTLKHGYDTEVGERGVKLSGGQKQRISIARAFLKNPKFLILDEATSSLDNVTEIQIQKSLEELSKGRTTLVVAHRLSTVKNADTIIVLTKDGILEQGTHQELLALNGIYANLYQHQLR